MESCQAKRHLLCDYQCYYAADCLCDELDEAYRSRRSLLCGNIRCNFRYRLAFTVPALEMEDKENERPCQQRPVVYIFCGSSDAKKVLLRRVTVS